jgi:hypothetical protein
VHCHEAKADRRHHHHHHHHLTLPGLWQVGTVGKAKGGRQSAPKNLLFPELPPTIKKVIQAGAQLEDL